MKIVGHLLRDIDSMVKTTLAIEREVDDARCIWDSGASDKRKGIKLLLLALERGKGLLLRNEFGEKAT